jgi:hypothetical protein
VARASRLSRIPAKRHGRKVLALISANHIGPDMAAEVFTLDARL